MEAKHLDVLLRSMYEELIRIFNNLPPNIQDAVRQQWRALLAAITAARAALASGSGLGAALRTLLQALRAFLAALAAAGVEAGAVLESALALLETEVAALGSGAGATAAAVALVIIAILAIIKSIYEIVIALGVAELPDGGMSCGNGQPVAINGVASSWSLWGESRAFEYAEEKARTAAQSESCPSAECETGTCQGNCIIKDITYAHRFLWTNCTVTYDVYCECY